MTDFVPPLKVHICWFESGDPRCAAIARNIYEFLHRPLSDDPVLRPGLEIPVEIGRDLKDLLDRLDAASESRAGMRIVIALLDQPAFFREDARAAVGRARDRWFDARADELLLPVLLDPRWGNELAMDTMDMLSGIALRSDEPAEPWGLPTDVGIIVGRALLRRLHGADAPRPRIFLSHAKADGATLARELAAYLEQDTRVDAWFDRTDLDRGEALAKQLTKATSDGVVLVVRTDRYSESPWCAMELLSAKRARVPIVTLLAGSDGEPLTSAYGGNHRTMVWKAGRESEVIARCVQAWLHGHHFRVYARAALALAGLPADSEVLSQRPELLDVTVGASGCRLIVHPDPPLTDGESTLLRLARSSVRIATPTTLFGRVLLAQDPEPPLAGVMIAFSLSAAPELPDLEQGKIGSGITQQHLDDVLHAIVLATLHSGAGIAYGGDFRKHQGYALKLSELLRSRRRLGTTGRAQLTCFLDRRARDGDGKVEFAPVEVELPAGVPTETSPTVRNVMWHLAMRDAMAARARARILLGGKSRPATAGDDGGYIGPWPGVLEEAWRTLQADKALYVIGGFGGAAGAIAEMLRSDVIPPEFRRATHEANPKLQTLIREVDVARAAATELRPELLLSDAARKLYDMEGLAVRVLERWRAFRAARDVAGASLLSWSNGLTYDENLRLFASTDRTEITHLVFEGLRRLARQGVPQLKVVLYHGDIATAPNVDGYAVTITPGVPLAGASAALDASMEGRLSKMASAPSEPVTVVTTDAAELGGTHVLVARLDLPPAGQVVGVEAVSHLIQNIAERADALGIGTIACSPFATTLGVDVAASAKAMIGGFRNTNARGVGTLVLCETNAFRYDQLRSALAAEAVETVELRPGPIPVTRSEAMFLNIDVVAPTATAPARVRSTLLLPDGVRAIVPNHDATLSLDDWNALRLRASKYAASVEQGTRMWTRLLSPDLQESLTRYSDRRLIIVTNEDGAGLPWEFLSDDKGNQVSQRQPLVRRIALSGAGRDPVAIDRTAARLRVLLVVNPLGDLPNTVLEANELEAALRGRSDIEVVRVEHTDATLERVERELSTGSYDVFHYAGHAFFDAVVPGRGGLLLCDRDVLTAAHFKVPKPPRLVYLSACESVKLRGEHGETAEPPPPSQPLAEAMLRSGVATLIGTFFAVADGPARRFAAKVYAQVAAGQHLGQAVLAARKGLVQDKAADWGNFMLYGDDTMIL